MKALAPIPPYTDYTCSYGDDSMKMMFGLPQSGIKRRRQEVMQKGTAAAAPPAAVEKKARVRSKERHSAMRNELKTLGISESYELKSYGLRSGSQLRQLRKRGSTK